MKTAYRIEYTVAFAVRAEFRRDRNIGLRETIQSVVEDALPQYIGTTNGLRAVRKAVYGDVYVAPLISTQGASGSALVTVKGISGVANVPVTYLVDHAPEEESALLPVITRVTHYALREAANILRERLQNTYAKEGTEVHVSRWEVSAPH